MVVSRSDIKRRQKDGEGGLPESPKRTKVHAQRKFAQGSNMNTPTFSPVKDKDKSKANGTVVPTELLPTKRPNTEDFLTFLCFRGTTVLPPKLDFFSVATPPPELHEEESKADQSVAGSSRVSTRCVEKSFSEQSFTVAKAETKTRNKPRPTAAVQAFKKKYQEQRLAKQKVSLTKLAQKVKGKNMVRTRSAALLEESRRGTKSVPKLSSTAPPVVKAKVAQKTLIKKSVKRLAQKQGVSSLRGGLRSGGELPPGSDEGLKSERKPRLIVKEQEKPVKTKTKKRLKVQTSKATAIASSLSDFSSDDDQPLIKKQRINLRRQRFQPNSSITTRSSQLGRLRRNRIDLVKNRVPNRPTRKTKEAAALFLEEMIGKDLKSPDEDSDDEIFSDKSFTDSSVSKKTVSERKEKEMKSVSEKNSGVKVMPKRDNSNSEITSAKKKKEEGDKKLLKKTVVKLNMMKEKDTKTVKKNSTDRDFENKPTTSKTVSKEANVVEPSSRLKNETKNKTLSNKSDRRHSLPETVKVVAEKRSTRQRPGNLSLDNSPSRLKALLNEFSDSDEEPLGNISSQGQGSVLKQFNARKSPVLSKETSPSRVASKKSESTKVENKKLPEKQSKVSNLKSKSVPRKDNLRKSVSEEDISLEEKLKSNSRTEIRLKSRSTKSTEDIDLEVKSSTTIKGVSKSGSVQSKVQSAVASNRVGSVKGAAGTFSEAVQKPKLKKGWVFCEDVDELTSVTKPPQKDTKTIKPSITDNASVVETSNKKAGKKSSTNIPKNNENTSDDVANENSEKISTKSQTQFNTSKNKTKQTNKKRNVDNAVENTSLTENTDKKNSQKRLSKGKNNSSEKNVKKSNLENPASLKVMPDSSVVSVKEINESVKKNVKNKPLNSGQDEVNQPTVLNSSSDHEISGNEKNSNNNQVDPVSFCKTTMKIDDSNQNPKLMKEINEDVHNPSLTDPVGSKNVTNKNNKALINKPADFENQEIKARKNKINTQKILDKAESSKDDKSSNLPSKDDFITKVQEKSHASDDSIMEYNANSGVHTVIVPDNDKINTKNIEKPLIRIESLKIPNVNDLSKNSSELDENKSEKGIGTVSTDGSCTEIKMELDKNKSNKKPNKKKCEEEGNSFVPKVEHQSFKSMSDNTKQDLTTQKIANVVNNNFETQSNVMRVVSNKTDFKEQPSASAKYITPATFNREVAIPYLPFLQSSKFNVEHTDCKGIEQVEQVESFHLPENTSVHHNLNRIPQQKPVPAQFIPSCSPKPENFPNERGFLKEGIRPVLEAKIPENADSRIKPLNLDQPKNMKGSQKIDEKLKSETFFGNTKEIKNVTINEPRLKVDMPLPGFQLLKSSTKAKSMLKPGTLIDIAGGLNVGLQSDSITNFMRPPLDNAMTKALKTDSFSPSDNNLILPSASPVMPKIEVKTEPYSFGTNKLIDGIGSNSDVMNTGRKERVGSPVSSKNKTSVNDTWRQAFKNVKIPKPSTSSVATNADKPTLKKPLSVTALAKKHTLAKSDTPSSDKTVTQPSIPFLRQSKLFLGGANQSQATNSKIAIENSKLIMNAEIRKKEAEVKEEIVRRYYAGEFGKSAADLAIISSVNEPPVLQTEINISNSNIVTITHQREEPVGKLWSGNESVPVKRTNSPITNVPQLKEDRGGRNNPVHDIKSNPSFALQQGNDNLDSTTSQPVPLPHVEDLNSNFSGSIFSAKDRTPSPSSLSRSFVGSAEDNSPRHIPIPNLPVFSKLVHSNASPNFSEAKHHHLPLPVEQTLKKLSQAKLPANKKAIPAGNSQHKPQEVKDVPNPVSKVEVSSRLPKSESEPSVKYDEQPSTSFDLSRANVHCLNKESSQLSVDLMAKKKVNMTTEEIKKWLSDSTSVGIEHKQNCGIFDKNHCECGYKNIPSNSSSENVPEYQIVPVKDEVNTDKKNIAEPVIVSESKDSKCADRTAKSETPSSVKASVKAFNITEVSNKSFVPEKENILTTDVKVVENDSPGERNETVHLKSDTLEDVKFLPSKLEDLNVTTKSDSNQNEPLSITSAESVPLKDLVKTHIDKAKDSENSKSYLGSKYKTVKPLKFTESPVKNKKPLDNEVFDLNTEVPSSPVLAKPKFVRQTSNKPGESEAELSSRDPSDVSSPPPRDDVSSSNDDSPDKFVHPERRTIFHQRRSVMKVKEKKDVLLSPSTSAFSPDNESSVYAFDPDLPPTSSTPPFRRCRKDGRTSSTATDDDESTPSSASIAVQVNLDNEGVLECSTQTEIQEADDDDGSEGHLFYIPLQQSHSDAATTQQLIKGVAVKLGTEGPDQRVIMRAKLVTKPPVTFSRHPSSNAARALIPSQISRSGKPEQKVRPLSVKPPVGTVTPTTRDSPSQPAVSIQTSPKPEHFGVDEKSNLPGPSKSAPEIEVKRSKTRSPDRTIYDAGKTPKRGKGRQSHVTAASVCSEFPAATDPAKLVEAPTFYPNEKEFQDPLEYIDNIRPLAEKFGLCRVVPPSDFKPECKVSDDMRFTAYNQYIHKMLHRWGPNVKEMMAIRKYLATESIALNHPPLVGGMEIDLPRLYQTVQVCGGLKEVIEKKRWYRVADAMKIPKSAQDRVTKLDDIYCKFLLPYDTLSYEERSKLFEEVENDWAEREKRVNNATDSDSEDSDSDDLDECIVKGRSMALNAFYRIARNTMSMWFSKTEQPSASEVEAEFWRHVSSRQCHVCVHSGSIDSGSVGYGFPVAKNSSTSRHPWNLKVLTNNPGSILRSLGPLMGVTVPTLHVGMLFSACCWYRDPHGLPWIEYLHTGASKIWYGIPDSSSSVFRGAANKLVPRLCRDKTIWLASDTAMVPPPLLVERGVSLCRVVQEPGQFIIVFPKAFTSSICTGYLVSESVYFAQPSWLASAQQIFDDIRESCEPSMFSLEKLLFSIATDTRTPVDVLNQILPMMLNIQDGEIARRKQLEELGLNNSERLPVNKRRKTRPTNDDEADYECDVCRANLFLSLVTNTHEEGVYCLSHAIELLSKKRSKLKHCNFLYTYSEDELNEVVDKLKSRIEMKTQKKLQGKSSQSGKS